MREGLGERGRQRERERETEGEREGRQGERQREIEREADRDRGTQREGETEGERERGGRQGERQREIERQAERDREFFYSQHSNKNELINNPSGEKTYQGNNSQAVSRKSLKLITERSGFEYKKKNRSDQCGFET